jgi:hypothetical protein
VHYSPERLPHSASSGLIQNVYENPKVSLKGVTAMAANYFGKLYWSNSETVSTDGALMSAIADAPDETSIQTESRMFKKISSLYYKRGLLYFVAPSDTSLTETAIYYKSMPPNGLPSKQINFVSDRFSAVVALSTIDNYIYVADSKEGFFAIES